MAASADGRYEVSCVDMSVFEALMKLFGSRSVCGRLAFWRRWAHVCLCVSLCICLYMTLFAYGELGNKPLLYVFYSNSWSAPRYLTNKWFISLISFFLFLTHLYSSTLQHSPHKAFFVLNLILGYLGFVPQDPTREQTFDYCTCQPKRTPLLLLCILPRRDNRAPLFCREGHSALLCPAR